ncbi:MAG TPA: farnesyl diphosphate synthase [Gemmatimonadota bacterium]|nr:farnesyl diphosphate synthase [Gemmatimonadota bacterium]
MTAGSAREAFAAEELPRIEAALERAVGRLGEPIGAVALYAVHAGGKRVRPLLTVAAFRAAGGSGDAIYPVAAAVELIHTYSLLHDDLPCMDDDSMRRGIPTAHRVYGDRVALAAGAALQQLAFLSVSDAAAEDPDPDSADRLRAMVHRLATAAGSEGMVGGQFLDLLAEGTAPDAAGLEAIHRAKTAALLSAACALGGEAAGAEPEVVDALAEFGTHLGLAFQIVDDLLDVSGDPTRTGKASGADAARAKATYPAVHGMEGARRQAEAAAEVARRALIPLEGRTEVDVLLETLDFVVDRIH